AGAAAALLARRAVAAVELGPAAVTDRAAVFDRAARRAGERHAARPAEADVGRAHVVARAPAAVERLRLAAAADHAAVLAAGRLAADRRRARRVDAHARVGAARARRSQRARDAGDDGTAAGAGRAAHAGLTPGRARFALLRRVLLGARAAQQRRQHQAEGDRAASCACLAFLGHGDRSL